MASFDLRAEPWIPVRHRDGGLTSVGLRNLLVNAHEHVEIQGDTPLESVTLNRLALALAMRILPELMEERKWRAAWGRRHEGFTPAQIRSIDDYLERHGARFDLLHPVHPFYQYRDLPGYLGSVDSPSAISRLFSDESSGNNPTLFSHVTDASDRYVPLAKAARGIVATQATALQGGNSKPFYLADAPLVGGAVFWIRGEPLPDTPGPSLYQALLLNAPPDDEFRITGNVDRDIPAWERNAEVAIERHVEGFVDYLTFQSRRVLLRTATRDGSTVATGTWYSQGDKIRPMPEAPQQDPLMARRRNDQGVFPYKMSSDRALWRDSSTFIGIDPNDRYVGSPLTLEWLACNARDLGRLWPVDVVGIVNNKGAFELWRHERIPIDVTYLTDQTLRNALIGLIDLANAQRKMLTDATTMAAQQILFPGKKAEQLSKLNKESARALASTFSAEARYWPLLELPFFKLYRQLPSIPAGDERHHVVDIEWGSILFDAAVTAYNEATRPLANGGRNLRALATGRKTLRPTPELFKHMSALQQENLK